MKTPELKKAIEWIEGQEGPYIKNEHGQFIYYSEHRSHGINLPHILSDYATSQIEEATRHSSETFKDMTERCNQYHAQIEELTKEVEKLREFKRYIHDRLDKMGIPSDPEPESNASHGCRIEGRLNVVDRYREALEDCVNRMKRARKILTGFSKEPNSWQMLNAEKYESLLHPLVKEGE